MIGLLYLVQVRETEQSLVYAKHILRWPTACICDREEQNKNKSSTYEILNMSHHGLSPKGKVQLSIIRLALSLRKQKSPFIICEFIVRLLDSFSERHHECLWLAENN